jgi:hypothetical protein
VSLFLELHGLPQKSRAATRQRLLTRCLGSTGFPERPSKTKQRFQLIPLTRKAPQTGFDALPLLQLGQAFIQCL